MEFTAHPYSQVTAVRNFQHQPAVLPGSRLHLGASGHQFTRRIRTDFCVGVIALLGLLLSGGLLPHQLQANQSVNPGFGPYPATVVRVIDGDTVELDVQLWPGLVQRINLRLAGINTPESRGRHLSACEREAARAATTFTLKFLEDADTLHVHDIRLGKFAGRVLGRIRAHGKDLGAALVGAGLARPYDGGHRGPWCD